jgi:hypothetical protein
LPAMIWTHHPERAPGEFLAGWLKMAETLLRVRC